MPRSVPRRTTSGARATVGAAVGGAAAAVVGAGLAGGALALGDGDGVQARAMPSAPPAPRRTKSRRVCAFKATLGSRLLITASPGAERLRREATPGSPPPTGG